MIQENDLRVGNWVERTNINYAGAKVERFQIKVLDFIHSKTYNPIPLTPEILEKCGFLVEKSSWFMKRYFTDCQEAAEVMIFQINSSSGRCCITDEDEGKPSYIGIGVISLHQLQNIYYSLTGTELEIQL